MVFKRTITWPNGQIEMIVPPASNMGMGAGTVSTLINGLESGHEGYPTLKEAYAAISPILQKLAADILSKKVSEFFIQDFGAEAKLELVYQEIEGWDFQNNSLVHTRGKKHVQAQMDRSRFENSDSLFRKAVATVVDQCSKLGEGVWPYPLTEPFLPTNRNSLAAFSLLKALAPQSQLLLKVTSGWGGHFAVSPSLHGLDTIIALDIDFQRDRGRTQSQTFEKFLANENETADGLKIVIMPIEDALRARSLSQENFGASLLILGCQEIEQGALGNTPSSDKNLSSLLLKIIGLQDRDLTELGLA